MKKRMFQMRCPFCGHSFQIMRDTLVIEGMDSHASRRLRNRTYFAHQCSQCRRMYDLVYPLILRCVDRFAIVLNVQCSPNDFGEPVYECSSPRQFYELYGVLSDGADWRIVLWLENRLKQNYNCDVIYESFDMENSIYYFYVNDRIMAVKYKKEHNEI